MGQDINITVMLETPTSEEPKLTLLNELQDLNHKIIGDFTSHCEQCYHNIKVNIYWKWDSSFRDSSIQKFDETPMTIHHNPLSEEQKSDNERDEETEDLFDNKSVMYPEMSYPLPLGLQLPSLKAITAPYFEMFQQLDGTVVYVEKKTKSKPPIRVTNYDPRSVICDLCNFEVASADRMTSHRKFHFFPKSSDNNCHGCGFFCPNNNEKQLHIYFCPRKSSMNGLLCIECGFEGTDFDDLREHLGRKHSGYGLVKSGNKETFVCKLCGVKMSSSSSLNTHMKHKCQKSGIQKYLSQLDLPENLVLPDLYKLKSSYSRTHKQPDGTVVYIGKRDNTIQIMNFDPTSEKCELCGKSHLKNKDNVVNHRLKMHFFPPHAGDVCQGCQREYKDDDAKKIHTHFCTKKSSIKVNYCNYCKEQFTNYPNFAAHLKKIHDGEGIERRFMCHLCSRSFEHDHQLQEHVVRHMDPKPFKCAHCESEQRNKKGIITHLIRFHYPTAAKFACDSCTPPMLFAYEKQYQCHIDALHLRLQKVSVPCPTCGKLIRKKGLKNHIQKQHTDTFVAKEAFECQTCGKIFFRRQNLEAHQLMHLPEDQRLYKCRFCERTFNKKLGFVEHERNHTGEKPYKCEHCGKAFARSSTFQDHKREHTGQRFVCSVCSKEYKDRGNYRHHMKQHEVRPF